MASVFFGGNYIDGAFRRPATPQAEIAVHSPADLDDHVGTISTSVADVDEALAAARAAQPGWERLSLEARVAHLVAFGAELKKREAALVALIGREVGKPAWEAKSEVAALGSKIEITVGEGLALVRGFAIEQGRFECRYRPHGVLAVIGPFNFPLHLAHGHLVPALATGNTVVFKPSEVAPFTAQLYAEAAHAAGFPAGVFNLVHGDGAVGGALSGHREVDGVLFTGSYDTGVRIQQANVARPGRMLALELGGKNTAVVLADAPFEKTLHDVVFSAFVTAGQRCTAVSRVVVEEPIAERFIAALAKAASRLVVGHPQAPGVFMGPLATRGGFEKFQRAQAIAAEEGAELVQPSIAPAIGKRGYYVTPSIHRVRAPRAESAYQHGEIFGPDVAVYVAGDADEACAIAEATPYGLAAGVFTASEARFEACARGLRVGCVAWNAPTVGSSSRLPFGGVKRSGNHRPAALFSTLYCTYPVAVTRGASELDRTKLSPGMGWDAGDEILSKESVRPPE